jgi:hypothetical protein
VRLSGWRTSTAVPLPIHSRASAPRAIYTPSQHSWRCGAAALSGPLRVCGCHLEYASTAGSYYSGVQRLSSIRPFSTARRNSSQNGRHRTAPHRTAPHRTAPHRVASRRAARCACNAAHSSVQKTTCDGRQSWFAVAVSVSAACMLPVARCMLPAVLCAVAWSWCTPMRCRLSLQGCARHATCLPSPVRATVAP